MSTKEVAERLGVTYGATRRALNPKRERDLTARQRERHREKRRAYDRKRLRNLRATCDTCGNPCGIGSGKEGTKRCLSCVHAQHVARDDRIVAMYQRGMSLADMATQFGCTIGSIGMALTRLRREGRITTYRYAGWERKQKV